jgi:hypothetical protein
MNPQELAKNPEIMAVFKAAGKYFKENTYWALAGIGAATAWGLYLTGNIVPPPMIKQYKPNSQEAKDLFKFASVKYGIPDWSEDPDLHYILQQESKGWVGIPNYTYGTRRLNKNKWPEVWAELKAGTYTTKSSATGLGQLLAGNAKKYYPDGLKGIGDPLNEAVGFIKYILDRYGSPAVARSVYNQIGEYTHAVTGKKCKKGFKEGY